MAHAIAKLLLRNANTFLARSEAIRTASSLGMPYAEIEAFLDWLDLVRALISDADDARDEPQDSHASS